MSIQASGASGHAHPVASRTVSSSLTPLKIDHVSSLGEWSVRVCFFSPPPHSVRGLSPRPSRPSIPHAPLKPGGEERPRRSPWRGADLLSLCVSNTLTSITAWWASGRPPATLNRLRGSLRSCRTTQREELRMQ